MIKLFKKKFNYKKKDKISQTIEQWVGRLQQEQDLLLDLRKDLRGEHKFLEAWIERNELTLRGLNEILSSYK